MGIKGKVVAGRPGTPEEIKFVDSLGTGRWANQSQKVMSTNRMWLLVKYLKSARQRDDWVNIDKEEVIRHVEHCLKTERFGLHVEKCSRCNLPGVEWRCSQCGRCLCDECYQETAVKGRCFRCAPVFNKVELKTTYF